jgi:hypothetical protein
MAAPVQNQFAPPRSAERAQTPVAPNELAHWTPNPLRRAAFRPKTRPT